MQYPFMGCRSLHPLSKPKMVGSRTESYAIPVFQLWDANIVLFSFKEHDQNTRFENGAQLAPYARYLRLSVKFVNISASQIQLNCLQNN